MCPRDCAGAAEISVIDILDVVYNLWLKISQRVSENGYVLGFGWRRVRRAILTGPVERAGLCQ